MVCDASLSHFLGLNYKPFLFFFPNIFFNALTLILLVFY